ncbi:MAG: calcium/sodium antiporter [Bacilli bacterium]|nr:calcium/sodium antiporter [Bacilli bacterium]
METVKVGILLLIGFIILVKSSDIFVDAVSSIATNFKMSKMMIALTVAAFGTCAPELAISFTSISGGTGDIALANVLGSNVVNILLVIGIAACIQPIKVKNEVVKKELPILLVITSMFVLSVMSHYIGYHYGDFILTRQDGIVFLCFFVMFIFYIVSVVKVKQGVFDNEKPKYNMTKSIVLTIICCVTIIFASNIVVDNAKELASMLKVSNKLITMTIVVIGTSLPEMTMTVVAAKKGEFDIALGNIIGTNIFNIGVVLGLPLLIYDGFSSPSFSLYDILFVHVAAYVLYLFARNDRVLSKVEGAIMIIIFVIYYSYIFLT